MTNFRHEILLTSKDERVMEVLYYQINIDNFRLAIEHIDAMPSADQFTLAGFRADLSTRLETEKLEQMKAQVMLDVIKRQIDEVENVPEG